LAEAPQPGEPHDLGRGRRFRSSRPRCLSRRDRAGGVCRARRAQGKLARRARSAAEHWQRRASRRWYERGGVGHVAAYLAALDLSNFNPKARPEKTPAFWAIVDANRAPEDAELADVLDKLERPDAVTLDMLVKEAIGVDLHFYEWLHDRKNRRIIPHRLEQCGYVPVRNDAAVDGLFMTCH
jgi:hypothetical protein